jgi:hypothetical protein
MNMAALTSDNGAAAANWVPLRGQRFEFVNLMVAAKATGAVPGRGSDSEARTVVCKGFAGEIAIGARTGCFGAVVFCVHLFHFP